MDYTSEIFQVANGALKRFNQSPAMRFFIGDKFREEHYVEMLRQVYHYTKENPQLQTLAGSRFKGHQRVVIKRFYQHAISEIGHEQLALNDLLTLNVDTANIPYENPLPTTLPLTAFPIYQITYRNPVGYLGFLLFLEWMPTQSGAGYMQILSRIGIPKQAMTFLQDHATVDVLHNKLMEGYIHEMVRTEADYESVRYCIYAAAHYYSDMLWGAIQQVENGFPWGWSHEELAVDGYPKTAKMESPSRTAVS